MARQAWQAKLPQRGEHRMKYFCTRSDWFKSQMLSLNADIVYEVDTEKALEMYELAAGAKKKNLVAKPHFDQGTKVRCKYWTIWGENISNAELFKRRLEGTIAVDILFKGP